MSSVSYFYPLIPFSCYACLCYDFMTVYSGGSSGMEVYDISETRNHDAHMVKEFSL